MKFWDHVGNPADAYAILRNLGLWPEGGVPADRGSASGWAYLPATRFLTPVETEIDRLMRQRPHTRVNHGVPGR